MRAAIWVRNVVAEMIEQQDLLADGPIGKADPAGKGWIIDRHSDDALLRQLLIS